MNYSSDDIDMYADYLKNVALLSKLFSEAEIPFLHYRTTEYLYCKLFNAQNISRSDVTIDAQKDEVGIGIKTFTYTGKRSQEKIAEFNRALDKYKDADDLSKVKAVALLRNERIELVERLFDVTRTMYHCIGRRKGELFVFEQEMNKINIENITLTDVQRSDNVINFSDGLESYSFNTSKSTLYKYFQATEENIILRVSVDMLADPLESIKSLVHASRSVPEDDEFVVLPLYSHHDGEPHVFEKSGLNRWRADGSQRKRRYGEVEIGIRADYRDIIHSVLPPREEPFEVVLPNKEKMTLKVSQADGKALMSNPETALGEWLLGDVLGLSKDEPVTYDRLQELGVDSIELRRHGNKWYMNFCELGSFEKFLSENR